MITKWAQQSKVQSEGRNKYKYPFIDGLQRLRIGVFSLILMIFVILWCGR